MGLKSTPSNLKDVYHMIMELEIHELRLAFKNKVIEAKQKFDIQKGIYEEIKQKLEKTPQTIKSHSENKTEES